MLILSRKHGEQIKIGDDVTITVCCVANSQVRIGIEAPPEVRVRRCELPPDARITPLAAVVGKVLAASPEAFVDEADDSDASQFDTDVLESEVTGE